MKKTQYVVSFESVVGVHQTQNHTNHLVTCPTEDVSLTRDKCLTCNEVRAAIMCITYRYEIESKVSITQYYEVHY